MTEEGFATCLWQQIEQVLSLPEEEREEEDIINVSKWFRDRSSLFHSLDTESLYGVIMGAHMLRLKPDHVVVHQGEFGACFYVIVQGSVSVYAKRSHNALVEPPVLFEVTTAKGAKERARFGQELTTLRAGRCFGELSVVGKTSERNASVITDEPSLLVCIDKQLYSKYVSEIFAIEIAHRSSYVVMHPLFHSWPATYRNLLAENLQYRKLKFGDRIIKQGNTLEYVYFIIEGQVKLTTNPVQHTECFPQLLSRVVNVTNDGEDNFTHPIKNINTIERRKLRQKEGFFASELRYREIDVCTVGAQGIIGDIEAIMDLNQYTVTAECIQELSVYEMDKSSFLKIIVKKNPETYEKMRRSVFERINYRNNTFNGGLPIYRALLTFFDKPKPKDNRKQILKSYNVKKSRVKPVTSNFFAELSKGRSPNIALKKQPFQPIRRVIQEIQPTEEEETEEVLNEKLKVNAHKKKTLWKNVGAFAGKLGVDMAQKRKQKNEVPTTQTFTADDYKELKKKLQVAGKTA